MAKRSPAPFGALLKQYRLAALLTQEQLAARAQLSPDAIRALERGKRRTPRAETVRLLAAALGLPDEEREALLEAALLHLAAPPHVTEAGNSTQPLPPPDVAAAAPLLDGDSQSPEAPLVGRQHEFEALRSAYERAWGGYPQVVLLEGEAGIGKTRLAREFLAWAQVQGAEVLRGQAYEAGARLPYQPVIDALRPRLGREPPPTDRLAEVWLAELVRLFPELAQRYPKLSVASMADTARDATAQGRLFEAIMQLCLALTAHPAPFPQHPRRPAVLALFLDDIQWADTATRELLQYVLRRSLGEHAPLLVLLAIRAEELATTPESETWLAAVSRQVPCTRLALGPLAAPETLQLVEALTKTRGQPGEEGKDQGQELIASSVAQEEKLHLLTDWLYEQTRGQPFYLIQSLRALGEQGVLVVSSSPDGGQRLHLPEGGLDLTQRGTLLLASVRALIRSRLTGVSMTTLDLLLAGAVLGQAFSFEHLCQIAGVSEREGLAALEEALQRRLIVEGSDAHESGRAPGMPGFGELGDIPYHFTHDLLREGVYEEASQAKRRVFHRRALEALQAARIGAAPAAELARHALVAGLLEETFRYSLAAGDEALAVFAVRDAIRYYEQSWRRLAEAQTHEALRRRLSAAEQERLYTQLGRAYEWHGTWEEARTVYQAQCAYAQAIGAPVLEASALVRLAHVAREQSWDLPTAQALVIEALAVVEKTDDRVALAETHWALAQIVSLAGELDVARPHAEQALELARRDHLRELVARSLNLIRQIAVQEGEWDKAVTAATEGCEYFAALADEAASVAPPFPTERTANIEMEEVWAQFLYTGPLPATAAAYRAMEASCLAGRATAEVNRGKSQAGIQDCRAALRLLRAAPNAPIEGLALYVLAIGLVETGAYEEALAVARRGVEVARASNDLYTQMVAWATLAQTWHALCQPEQARMPLQEALALAERIPIKYWSVRPWSWLVANRALSGDWESAYTAALQVSHLRETLQVPHVFFDLFRSAEMEALARQGDSARARRDMQRLEEYLRPERQYRRYRLVLLRMQAVLAQHEGQTEAALLQLEEALRLAEEMQLPGEQWQMLATLWTLFQGRNTPEDALRAEKVRGRANALIHSLAGAIHDAALREAFLAGAMHQISDSSTW